MKIHETLDRDPRASALANSGQARINNDADPRAIQELRAELETFVCDGQYGEAIGRVLQSYLAQLDQPRQNAAWVSGFFGSGKSHLLKMLGHLWVDTQFEDGATARSLVRGLPDDLVAQLRELDTRVTRSGKAPIAASGTLPAGSGDHVRLTVLSVILRACGLPEQYPQAEFCFWLRQQGHLGHVRGAVEAAGKDWFRELNNLYVSGLIAKAILERDPDFARDEREARQVLRERFPARATDVGTSEFLLNARQALAAGGELPLTILVLDEVQQYIGDSTDRAVMITEIAEAIQTQLDSRVMLVMSGQSALSGTPQLQKLRDRFRITVQLSDTDVEAVTRKVLLHKKPSGVDPIRKMLESNAGEISKQLQGTKLAERPEDRAIIIDDYPLLPTRRRFWEECFRKVDAAGTQSQLRSQLRIIFDALKAVADKNLGAVIPADALYEALAPDMVNTGVLLNQIANRIQQLDDGTDVGRLRKRIAGVVFLISRLSQEGAADVGIRATSKTVADLLVSDIQNDSGPFRKSVDTELEAMTADGTLMKVGDDYRLQTTEGAEWDRAFREKVAALRQQENELTVKRDQLLATSVQKTVSDIRLLHGDSKIRRTLTLHARPDEPAAETDQIVVWLRDGWSTAQKEVENEARRRGHEDPVIQLFLPRKAADDLRARIIDAEAARIVLDIKGVPSSPEGREARESMQSRLNGTENARDELIRQIVNAGKVYQGGGSEIFDDTLRARLETAADASLSRLFPRFNDGDHKAWETALKRAKDGSDEPLKIVGWDKGTEDHPVVRQVLTEIGNGARGGDIRKTLKATPYGWPQDAVDAALIALHRAGSIRATVNGQPVAAGQLDQNRISSAEFQPEKIRLGTTEKLAIRGLYQKIGVGVKSGEEEVKATAFLDAMIDLARAAGGDAPMPTRPSTTNIEDLKKLTGSEQLGKILGARADLESMHAEWSRLKQRAEKRLPQWERLALMAQHADGLDVMAQVGPEMQAIRAHRSLLEDTDYVQPLCKKVEHALRDAMVKARSAYDELYDRELDALAASANWQKLSKDQQNAIVAANHLKPIPALDVGDEMKLLRAVQQRTVAGWGELTAALHQRFAHARADAARELEPKTQTVSLRSDTLRSEADVKQWLSETEADLLKRLGDGPIVIG